MLSNFIKELVAYAKTKVISSFILFILLGLTQGIGLVLILPFISTLGLTSQDSGKSQIDKIIKTIFDAIGIPLNLNTFLIIYIIIIIIFALLDRYQAVLNIEIQQGFTRSWQNRLYRALTHANWLFITREKSSDITHVLTADCQQVGAGTILFMQLSGSSVLIFFQLAVAFWVSPLLTSIIVCFGLLMIIFMKPLNREALETGISFRTWRREMYKVVIEHLTGMKTAKSYGTEEQHIERIETINRGMENRMIHFTKTRSNTRFYYEVFGVLFLSGFTWIAVQVLKIPAPRLLLLAIIFIRIFPRISTLQQQYQNIKNMLPAFTGMIEFYKKATAEEETRLIDTYGKSQNDPFSLLHNITFQNVFFRYSEDNPLYAVDNVNFEIPARKVTAIVGPSGAGKSTIADLLLGLLAPEKGIIIADGRPIGSYNYLIHNNESEDNSIPLIQWRHSIAYVPQETFLFHDTLRANLLWANPNATEEELWDALRMASAEDFVLRMPQGLDTLVGDRGITLSGGERQRIALARALLRKPQLLLLDEATSAIDNENELRIRQAIQSLQGKITVVIIAHRLSTIRNVEHIIVMENGQIMETGTPQALINKSGGFLHRMNELQLS